MAVHHWSCAALARSRNERPDTFACFLCLRNTAWAGHIRFKNSTGEWGWWFRRGEDSGFVSKEKQKEPVKEQGFSLLEVLIAMAISTYCCWGLHAFCLRYSVKV